MFKSQFGPKRLNKKNPRIKISRYTSHSLCDECVKFIEWRKVATTENELKQIRKAVDGHRLEYSGARIEINRQMQLSLTLPKDYLGLAFDDMDNMKSYLPKITENPKSLVGLKRIKTKITGCIISSSLYEQNRKCHFMTNHDQFENGSDKNVTVIYNLLQIFLNDFGFLPHKLFIQTDNCWRENKNKFVLAFLYCLVEMNIFEEIIFSFLHVGHTGFAVDQLFSILAAQFKNKEILTIEDLHSLVRESSITPKPSVESLEYIFDWKSFIEPRMTTPHLANHTFKKSFIFFKEDGLTKMSYKTLPQDPLWCDKKHKVLESCAAVDSVGAAPFRVESLRLEELEAEMRKFLKKIPTGKAIQVQSSWEQLRKKIERTERIASSLPKMDLTKFVQNNDKDANEDMFDFEEDSADEREVIGEVHPEKGNVSEMDDVAVYTEDKDDRPCVGRVMKVLNSNVRIHWFKKRSRRAFTYEAAFVKKGVPHTDMISISSIIYTKISSINGEKIFSITPMWNK